ncbi:hypothetical protein CSKR_112887 [Clonorchis sinensis]|uniref:Uncharacterized protein n=1 Tax=Clonorchis sinensis TaxID=79923 RepID=A0A8T1LZ34_CLOSI|nr:hypothetical protein CSKR_112887 [Clonorchis sinensis]
MFYYGCYFTLHCAGQLCVASPHNHFAVFLLTYPFLSTEQLYISATLNMYMARDSTTPPLEPYKAATTILPGHTIPPLPSGARRLPHEKWQLNEHESSGYAHTIGSSWLGTTRLACPPGIIVRELPEGVQQYHTPGTQRSNKPMAAVIPTTSLWPESSVSPASSECYKVRSNSTADAFVQTDDVAIDMDLLLHIEDMLRTQRSISMSNIRPTSIVDKSSIQPRLSDIYARSTHVIPSSQSGDRDDLERLRQALVLQNKVNDDLKRLLVSALAGNSDLADKLVDLTSDNANLSGRSQDLAAQKAVLAEAASTAEIAADVWRAKCLAGRVVATEAARRLTLANRQAQLTRHALAHLLGERARIRLQLGQAAGLLLSICSRKSPGTVSAPVPRDTLSLASLCNHLAAQLQSLDLTGSCSNPVLCQSDTPGELLAMRVLTNTLPEEMLVAREGCQVQNSQSQQKSDLPTLVPPITPSDSNDLIQKALDAFSSTRFLGSDSPCIANCRGCRGDVTVI